MFSDKRVFSQKSSRAFLLASTMMVMAGCSADVTRLNIPLLGPGSNQDLAYTASTDRSIGPLKPIPVVPIGQSQLPAVNQVPTVSTPRVTAPTVSAPRVVVHTPQVTAPQVTTKPLPQPEYTVASTPQVSSRIRQIGGGFSEVEVRSSDNLQIISRRYGISEKKLLAANNLSAGQSLQAGQKLIIPPFNYQPGDPIPSTGVVTRRIVDTTQKQATVAVNTAKQQTSQTVKSSASALGGYHTVVPGDTVYSISRRYQISASQLIEQNQIAGNNIKIGQRLNVGQPQVKTVVQTTVAQTEPSFSVRSPTIRPNYGTLPSSTLNQQAAHHKQVKVASLNQVPSPTLRQHQTGATAQKVVVNQAPAVVVPTARPAHTAPKTKVAALQPTKQPVPSNKPLVRRKLPEPKAMTSNKFRWPVRGRIISGFGNKAGGAHNDGINIAVPRGTSVKAAENGVVAYAGNELQGFGNLILIRHANDWVTAYAHNSDLLVKRGDTVSRGQVIAKAGQTGSVSKPQLHFEIRKGSRPVDPTPHMSGS